MCGINAVINGTFEDVKLLHKYSSRRGIHSKNTYVNNAYIVFDWLPITDNNAPNQPFRKDGVSVFLNGYISNYKELAKKYGIELKSNCDTELLCEFLHRFKGKRIKELNGFFAVLWTDGYEWHTFTDRYGIKQLYKYHKDGVTYISSELKTIVKALKPEIDSEAMSRYKYSLGVLNKDTIYKGVERVKKIELSIPETIEISYEDAKTRLSYLLDKSIERNRTELKSCVFLSGGIDSGIIAKRVNPNYCFSVDYTNTDYSEIDRIKLNSVSEHYVLMCNDAMKSDKVKDIIDDPKAGSCYTNIALTEFASKFCTVIYSGAGGDEFCGGYPHRLNKDIKDVQKRTKYEHEPMKLTHFEYDLMFLDSILVIEDSISGYYTMEARYPLLDNDVVNFLLSLPDKYKENKRILKDISGLDEQVINGKKHGFSNPHYSNDEWVDFTEKYIYEQYL